MFRSGRGHDLAAKPYALADACGRIVALALRPGNIADITMALPLLEAMRPAKRLIADKAYDADKLRKWHDERQIEAVIQSEPPEARSIRWTAKPVAAAT